MWIKLKNDNETIIKFGYSEQADFIQADFDVEVPYVDMLDKKGRIQYKYVGVQLIALTLQEKIDHPIWKKYKENKRIAKLKAKIQELRELNEIKDSTDLTNSEKTEVAKRITDKTAESIDDASDDL